MRASSTSGEQLTYPNSIFYSRGRFAYLRYSTGRAVENEAVTVTLSAADDESKSVTLQRRTNAQGVVVFPIGIICEDIVSASGHGDVNIKASSADGASISASAYCIAGYCDREITIRLGQITGYANYPAARKVVLLPELETPHVVFVPYLDECDVKTESGTVLLSGVNGPFFEFDPYDIPPEQYGDNIVVASTSGNMTVHLPALYDTCPGGVILRWVDKAGIQYIYRWSQAVSTDELTVNATYTRLDNNLQPYDVKDNTVATRYELHSRIVERALYDMVRTIIGCREVWMYNTDILDWDRCTVEEAESEDTGAPMQDFQIEVVKYVYNV